MGVAATIKFDTAPLDQALQGLISFGSDKLPAAFDEIGEAMVSSTQRRINAGVGPDGAPWKPSQRVAKHGGTTLKLTGRLFRSLTHNLIGGGVEWGTNVVYGAIHQFGGSIVKYAQSRPIFRKVVAGKIQPKFVKRSKSNFQTMHAVGEHTITMPARPFLGIDAEDTAEIGRILNSHMLKAMGGVFAS